MLRYRLLAALLGLPIIFALLYCNWLLRTHGSQDDLPLLILVLVMAGPAGWEVSRIVRHRVPTASPWNGAYAAMLVPFLVHAARQVFPGTEGVSPGSVGLLIDSLGATAAVMLLFLGVWGDIETRGWQGVRENAIVLTSSLYVGAATSVLLLVGHMPLHEVGVAGVIASIFMLDTAAYFGGRLIGGPKLMPNISPKKTIAGAVVGFICAVGLTMAYVAMPAVHGHAGVDIPAIASRLSLQHLGILGATIGVLGQFGDLAESMFKRWGGVKDSGTAIIGHGGFLDRFDSLFLAAPACYLLLVFFFRG